MEMTLDEAKKELARLVERAMQGEQVVIADDAEHGVLLVPVKNWKHTRKAGTGKGLFILSEDFDDPIPGFEEYLP
jgi:prevent-host-death family protein